MASTDEIASAGTYLSKDKGVEVTDGTQVRVTLGVISSTTGDDGAVNPIDYGLKVLSSDGTTVIVDGTSDVFKIVASGTLATTGFTGPGLTTASVNLATGITYAPAYVGWAQRTSGIGSYNLPALTYDQATGLIDEAYQMESSTVSGNQTQILVSTGAKSGFTEAARTYRYFVLQETAF